MNDGIVLRLVPRTVDEGGKPLILESAAWRKAVELVSGHHYRPNTDSGLDRASVAQFCNTLRLALEEQPDDARELASLVAFLNGDGRKGFRLTRGYYRGR